ncbi:MAG: GntR family transcriptional regulator [Propionivibrio sp.]
MPTVPQRQESTTLADRVYEEIRSRILYRQWGDGHHALEQEIAEDLGASRTPVRQALSRLQSDGLIKIVPRHGIRVLPMSPREVRETYQVFTRLESLAVELSAARHPTRDEFEPLERANHEMAIAHAAGDVETWTRADEAFHYHLVALSGNRVLNEVHQNFWGRALRARLTMLSLMSPPARSTGEHAQLLTAIREGNPALARARLEAHFEPIISYVNALKEQSIMSPY